jgi:predicted nucleic acid-binding protein
MGQAPVKLDKALADVRLLGVDTAPFIYFTEQRAGTVDKMRTIFRRVFDEAMVAVVSTIILPEILAKPLKESDAELVAAYRSMFDNTQGIILRPVSAAIAYHAANLRARYNLKTPDALHIATAIEAGCQAFLTNDLDLRRVNDIQVLALDDLE